MTTLTATTSVNGARGSAYPPAVAVLLPRARDLATELGKVPSRNQLMRHLRVGATKASALLAELTDDTTPLPTSPNGARRAEQPPEPASSDQPDPQPGAVTSPAAWSARVAPPIETTAVAGGGRVAVWPVWLLALPAMVAIWSGWVGLGGLTGFGTVRPLPGIWDGLALNTAITLPIGMETYAAFALRVWLSGTVPARARRFARTSAITALVVGAAGQVAYNLMNAAGITAAPWWITTVVACLPVAVLGLGAALAHLLRTDHHQPEPNHGEEVTP